MADSVGNTGCLDITPLQKYPPSRKRSRADFAPVDQGLDMGRMHRVVTVLANQCDRFSGGYPVVAHRRLSQCNVCMVFGQCGGGWFAG